MLARSAPRVLGLAFLASCSSAPDTTDAGTDAATDGDAGSGVMAVPLSVCTELAYTAMVSIGAGQSFPLLFDTASTTLGVAGSACTTCKVMPLYTPGATATDMNATAKVQFAIGSWSGEIYSDMVGLAPGPSTTMNFVSITTQSGFLNPAFKCGASPTFNGVLGFARAPEAAPQTDAFFDKLVLSASIPDVFATELCDSGGTLWLGGYDGAATAGSVQYTPFKQDAIGQLYYAVDLESIAVLGTSVSAMIPTGSYGDTVVDTGTSAIFIPTAAFNALTSAIAGTSGFQQAFGADGGASLFTAFPPCANVALTKAQLDAMLPALTLTFGTGAAAITAQALPTESYLWADPKRGWCSSFYAVDPTTTLPFAAILGSPIVRSNVFVFDRANRQLGIAPHAACP
jgi:hypothetical protein